MNRVTLTNGATHEYDEVIIHKSGWVECLDMNVDTRYVNDRKHYPPHKIDDVEESDTVGKTIRYQ